MQQSMRNLFNRLIEQSSPSSPSDHTVTFVPQIKISPQSTLHLQIEPKDPHTACNIVINAYKSKQNRSIIPIKVEWSRYKFKTEEQYTVDKMTMITGNTYMCEPADLGSIIEAKVKSLDPMSPGDASATIGPIRIDPIQKRLIDGALYSQSLLSQIIVLQGKQKINANFKLTPKTMDFVDESLKWKLSMPYTMSQPRIQLNPKDPTKIYLRFQQDQSNTVRSWLNQVFNLQPQNSHIMNETSMSIKVPHSNASSIGSSSKHKLFNNRSHQHCINKIQVRFLSRNARDLFLFVLRAFVCKEDMKNSVILEKIQTLQGLKTEQEYNKFLQYISLKSEIVRLAEIAKDLQNDRDNKVKDINNMQESISEMTLTYLKIIEEKSKHEQVDLEQSYSMISMKREEILGRKNLRELKTENEQLKVKVRDLAEQVQLQKFFREKDNESMLFNQTTNPFAKKNISQIIDQNQSGSYYEGRSPAINVLEPQQHNHRNMLEISKSYVKVLEQNKKLKSQNSSMSKKRKAAEMDESRNIENLLESLHENEQIEEKLGVMQKQVEEFKRQAERHEMQKLQALKENQRLKRDIQHINKRVKEIEQEKNLLQVKLEQVSASNTTATYVKTTEKIEVNNKGNLDNSHHNHNVNRSTIENLQNISFRTGKSSNTQNNDSSLMSSYMSMNESMTSQAELMILEKKLTDLARLNEKFESENTRLRKERDYYRKLFEQKSAEVKALDTNNTMKLNTVGGGSGVQVPAERDIDHHDAKAKNPLRSVNDSDLLLGQNLDNSMIVQIRNENEQLQNEKNSLLRKIQSLTREANTNINKTDPLTERKMADLVRQNDKLFAENQRLEKTIENMKSYHEVEKRELQKMGNQSSRPSSSLVPDKQHSEEVEALKKKNKHLLEELKELKVQMERKNDINLKNSRVIELQSQLDLFKSYANGSGGQTRGNTLTVHDAQVPSSGVQSNKSDNQTQNLVQRIGQLQKENQRLKEENENLSIKIKNQTTIIEKLMAELDEQQQLNMKDSAVLSQNNSFVKKYVNAPIMTAGNQQQLFLSNAELNHSVDSEKQKYKKKIFDLEKELQMFKKNSEAMSRSRDLSMSMMGFEEEKMELLKKQNESLLMENQNLSKMCSKYAKDAREANMEIKSLREKLIAMNKEIIEKEDL